MVKPRKINPAQELVTALINTDGISWAKEVKIAKELLAENNDLEHWRSINETLDFAPDSLVFFRSEYGKKVIAKHFSEEGYKAAEIRKKLEKLELERPKSYNLEQEPVVEFQFSNSKPKTFKEFLENYGTK